jgi:hypothetical protein
VLAPEKSRCRLLFLHRLYGENVAEMFPECERMMNSEDSSDVPDLSWRGGGSGRLPPIQGAVREVFNRCEDFTMRGFD